MVLGHLVSAFIGVSVYKIFPNTIWISAPLAVSLSILLMQLTRRLHPPGGATALIAVIGSPKIKSLGYLYILHPVLSGVLVLLIIAIVINNVSKNRKYPNDDFYSAKIKKGLKVVLNLFKTKILYINNLRLEKTTIV